MPRKRTVTIASDSLNAESRTGQRFPLELPIIIRNQDSSDSEQAVTCDLSASGVYIQAKSKMNIGTTIEFEIALPAAVVGTEGDVSIRCKGRVVRMEDGDPDQAIQNGVACVIDQYEFVRKDKITKV